MNHNQLSLIIKKIKYDIHLIGMIIEFVRFKLDDYVDYKKSIDEANNIEDDKKIN
ncbi:MAG: hypothetical protein KIB43_07480 [Clostridium baratii]|uniref:hypothetical protein n=1 Tax=Clostridium baratii TaxID=1561 RepID=UPI000AC754CC|nr:hypothetical protein [Clostridium baratii]MBS6006787.1 hypothetical protein [Clostridium baratii]MDU4910416.1 hypothetical protein [Clostridium baratii]